MLASLTLKRHVCMQENNLIRSNVQHREILDALRSGDPAWASIAMTGHILATKPTPADAAKGLKALGKQGFPGEGGVA